MSIELRMNDCYQLECDWGKFDNPEGNPDKGLQPLLLLIGGYVKQLLDEGPIDRGLKYGVHSASTAGHRTFVHVEADTGNATWEVFEAHWWDNGEPVDIMVGRWPD